MEQHCPVHLYLLLTAAEVLISCYISEKTQCHTQLFVCWFMLVCDIFETPHTNTEYKFFIYIKIAQKLLSTGGRRRTLITRSSMVGALSLTSSSWIIRVPVPVAGISSGDRHEHRNAHQKPFCSREAIT